MKPHALRNVETASQARLGLTTNACRLVAQQVERPVAGLAIDRVLHFLLIEALVEGEFHRQRLADVSAVPAPDLRP
jgi:hypothetical protein